MSDHFLQYRPRKPKLEIADYVASQGISVPRRWNTVEEARLESRAKSTLIVRSEHPQDYDGVSGLFMSCLLKHVFDSEDYKRKDTQAVEQAIKKQAEKEDLLQFVVNIDLTKLSCSFWEYLSGLNNLVCADSCVPKRYHIFTRFTTRKEDTYTQCENGKLQQTGMSLSPKQGQFKKIIALYEQVRALNYFDANHCPIMEFQTTRHGIFFLQYRRARDFTPARFKMDSSQNNTFFVRGATTPKGIVVDAAVTAYPNTVKSRAIIDINQCSWPGTINANEKSVYVIQEKQINWKLADVMNGHLKMSKLFLPEISVGIEKLVTQSERINAWTKDTPINIKIHIISDGTHARITRC